MPLVDLYAPTNPQRTPWQSPSRMLYHEVACRNCYRSVYPQGHHGFLRKVEPGRMVEAVHGCRGQSGSYRVRIARSLFC
jgi:hypothetical protein